MKSGKSFWLPFLIRYRSSSLLINAIKEADQFIRYPKIFGTDCNGLDLPLIQPGEQVLFQSLSPVWDAIITDEATRKIIFVAAASSPREIKACQCNASLRASLEVTLKAYFPQADPILWFEKYGELAERILWMQILNDPKVGCLERGYRSEMIFLQLVNDTTDVALTMSAEEWKTFTTTCIRDLVNSGDSHLLRNFFFSDFLL